jgi:cytoskeletal protein CcmA (bactofilin family)
MVADHSGPETREVVCTHCDRPIEIPVSAMSVNCRHCHRRVIIEDLKIKAYHAVVRLATAGKVEVTKNAQVVARVRVNELVVNGTVKGDVTAMERVQVGKKGRIYGDVACRWLSVQVGACLEGHFRVEPESSPVAEPATENPEKS